MPPLLRRLALGLALALSCALSFAQAAAGAQATVADTAEGGGAGGGVFFIVTAIEGVQVQETALGKSLLASRNQGIYMKLAEASRPVNAGKVTLTLTGTEATAAPIQSIFRSVFKDGNRKVSGTVTVVLEAGKTYKVKGLIDSFRQEVWLEDEAGVQVPSSKLAALPDPALIEKMEGAVYAATNIRYEGDWISEFPRLDLPFIPAGSLIKVLGVGVDRANVLVEGHKMRIGLDQPKGGEKIQALVDRLTSRDDPHARIRGYPETIRYAVRSGRVLVGMTKEQVLLSLGRPRLDHVPDLAAAEWKYDVQGQGEVYLAFDEAGLLKAVDASRGARALLLYAPK